MKSEEDIKAEIEADTELEPYITAGRVLLVLAQEMADKGAIEGSCEL